MPDKKNLFRTSFGGYNKEDVNNYIATVNASFTQDIDELNSTLKDKNIQLNELSAQIDTFKSKLTESEGLREELANAKKELDEKNKVIDDKNAELTLRDEKNREMAPLISASNDIIEKLKAENQQLRTENTALSASLDEKSKKLTSLLNENESIEEIAKKAKRFDDISKEYGSTILEARTEANSIITDARMEADILKSDAIDAVQDIKENAHKQIEITLEGTDKSFKNLIMNFVDEYTSYANKIHTDLDNIISGAKSRVDDICYTIPAPKSADDGSFVFGNDDAHVDVKNTNEDEKADSENSDSTYKPADSLGSNVKNDDSNHFNGYNADGSDGKLPENNDSFFDGIFTSN